MTHQDPLIPHGSDSDGGEFVSDVAPPVATSDSGHADLPPHRQIIVVTLSIFMGYATLVLFQHQLKQALDIADDTSDLSYQFSFATSFLYIGNLLFRLLHNAVFVCFTPRQRVYVSMSGYVFVCMNVCCMYVCMPN